MTDKLPMNFKALHVYKYSGLSGTIEVDGDAGKVELKLNDEELKIIMGVCADSLVRIAGVAAERMKEAILTTVQGDKP